MFIAELGSPRHCFESSGLHVVFSYVSSITYNLLRVYLTSLSVSFAVILKAATMPNETDIKSTLEEIRSTYSVCDVWRSLYTITSMAECSDILQ
jgi:hypothetical protein